MKAHVGIHQSPRSTAGLASVEAQLDASREEGEMLKARKRNGKSSCYFGADGLWHGRVTVGRKPGCSADRHYGRET
jgi:hypothetical protein